MKEQNLRRDPQKRLKRDLPEPRGTASQNNYKIGSQLLVTENKRIITE